MNEDLMKDEELKKIVLKDLLALAAANNFNGLEKCRAFKLTLEMFSQENDLLTPTMKLKRNIAKIYYQKDIEELYS
jgi:long-chain acyl-CoA synthetase